MSALEGEGAAPAPAKPTKYDITIEHGDGKIPFVLGQMPGRPVGAKLNKILDKKFASLAQVDDILVAVNKTIVLKLGMHNILLMLDELRRSQKKSHKPIVCRFVNAKAAKDRQAKRNADKKRFREKHFIPQSRKYGGKSHRHARHRQGKGSKKGKINADRKKKKKKKGRSRSRSGSQGDRISQTLLPIMKVNQARGKKSGAPSVPRRNVKLTHRNRKTTTKPQKTMQLKLMQCQSKITIK